MKPRGRLTYREFRPGRYYCGDATHGDGTSTFTLNSLIMTLFTVGASTRFNKIGVWVTAGVASTTARLGLYRGYGHSPVDLEKDAGAVDVSTTGLKEIAIDITLPPGYYWLGMAEQGAGGATYRSKYGYSPEFPIAVPASGTHVGTGLVSWGVTGTLPVAASPTGLAGSVPAIIIRAA